jgi:hypothetical protein
MLSVLALPAAYSLRYTPKKGVYRTYMPMLRFSQHLRKCSACLSDRA